MPSKAEAASWRAGALAEEREQHLEYRVLTLWRDGHRRVQPYETLAEAEAGYAHAVAYREAVDDGARIVLESRFVDAWEEDRSESLGRSKGVAAEAQQRELFA